MRVIRDFHWTPEDREAGFPALRAAFAATATDVLCHTYVAQMRDCLTGMFKHNMCQLQRELAQHLLDRGVTHIPTMFGDMAVTIHWEYRHSKNAAPCGIETEAPMDPWEAKAQRLIYAMCSASYRQANPYPRRRHRPYSVPALAEELLTCLRRGDEAQAKAIFLAYDATAEEYKV